MQIFAWLFAFFAVAINHVASHRISKHSIDTSGKSLMKEARHGIEDLGAQDWAVFAPDDNETGEDELAAVDETGEPAAVDATGVIAALDQYATEQKSKIDEHSAQRKSEIDEHSAQQKSEIDEHSAQRKSEIDQQSAQQKSGIDQQQAATIDFLKQPSAELIVTATNSHLETIKRQNSTIHQLRDEIEHLRHPAHPGYFVWNISGEDFSGVARDHFVESPKFNLFPRSPTLSGTFWLRYYPEGTFASERPWYVGLYLKHNGTCDDIEGILTADSASRFIEETVCNHHDGLKTWGSSNFMNQELHVISVSITKDCDGSAAFLD
ncbi:unnamed protein product [Symbiodinium sp. CCMP2456]|nr:unnamed protein product [Symbiodinium sp. CCMP2456]